MNRRQMARRWRLDWLSSEVSLNGQAFVSHAPGTSQRRLCGKLNEIGILAVGHEPTCNACQPAAAKPVYDRNRPKHDKPRHRFSGQRRQARL